METLLNDQVNENLTRARERMKSDYDKGKRDTECNPGDWVYLGKQKRTSGLSEYFEGPFLVLTRRGPNVKLRVRCGKEKVVHLNRCKKCPTPDTELHLDGIMAGQQPTENMTIMDPDEFSEHDSDYNEVGSTDDQAEVDRVTQLRRSNRQRNPPKWLRDETWPEKFSDDSGDTTSP